MATPGLLELFDRTYVVNLPERTDRRRQVEAELRRPILGSAPEVADSRVRIFAATWPDEAAPFDSTGTKGCFLSHLSILTEARDDDLESVLVLEDDAEFEDHVVTSLPRLAHELSTREWGVVQLGHLPAEGAEPVTGPFLLPFRGEVIGTHCYAVHRRALAPLVAHFERQLAGTPGDDTYGPMAPDGTLNTFAWAQDEVDRHLVVPSLCRQRSSWSSVNPRPWDRWAGARTLVGAARRARRSLAH